MRIKAFTEEARQAIEAESQGEINNISYLEFCDGLHWLLCNAANAKESDRAEAVLSVLVATAGWCEVNELDPLGSLDIDTIEDLATWAESQNVTVYKWREWLTIMHVNVTGFMIEVLQEKPMTEAVKCLANIWSQAFVANDIYKLGLVDIINGAYETQD